MAWSHLWNLVVTSASPAQSPPLHFSGVLHPMASLSGPWSAACHHLSLLFYSNKVKGQQHPSSLGGLMCLINSHKPRTGACTIYGTKKWENVPYYEYQVTNAILPKFGCETRSLWNALVLSAHQIFNPDMSCLNYSGAHKPFIRIRGEIFGLICKSHISKDLGGSFSIPSRRSQGGFSGLLV